MSHGKLGVFLSLYRAVHATGVLSTPWGRASFEAAYRAYKTLVEAGPVGALRPLVQPGAWVIDVGANVGFFSERFARWVSEGGRVVAIEPESLNFQRLGRRLSRLGLAGTVDTVEAAASERAGKAYLEINPHHPGDHKLADHGIAVSAVTIDGLMAARKWPPVGLIKIDVQGAEARVLKGARRTLERHRPALFVEIEDGGLRRHGSDAETLCAGLVADGYAMHVLGRRGISPALAPSGLAPLMAGKGYADILFLPGDR